MRIAVHNPNKLSQQKNHDIYGWMVEFFRKYRPLVYLYTGTRSPRFFFKTQISYTKEQIQKQLKDQGIEYGDDMFIKDITELNQRADILLGFTGEYFVNPPEKRFKGLKIYHTVDYQDYAQHNSKALKKAGVQYVFATGQADDHSPFFRKHFPQYVGKVLSFPFGYSTRFTDTKAWSKRKNKAVSVGSVVPMKSTMKFKSHEILVVKNSKVVHKPLTDPIEKFKWWTFYMILNRAQTKDFQSFHKGYLFTTPFRRIVVEHEDELKDIVDSKLPHYPKTKDFSFDMVECLNAYKMIHIDDGLIEICGAKVYEAAACGSVPVIPDRQFYDEFGWVDGETCIRYTPMDLVAFHERVEHYQKHGRELEKIRKAAKKHVLNFTHAKIAARVHELVTTTWERNQ